MNVDEALAKMDASDFSKEEIQYIIDENLRVISIPPLGVVLGVEGDKDVNSAKFKMVRYYKGIDLSKFDIRINFANANGDLSYYTVKNPTVTDDTLTFEWLVGYLATKYKGTVRFVVRMITTDTSTGEVQQAFDTTVGEARSLEGLLVDTPTDEKVYDIVAQLKADLTDHVNNLIETIPDDYSELTQKVEDNTSGISELKEEISDLDSKALKSEEIILFQRNIINVNNLISGKYIDNQGNLKDNANYSATNYEFVEPDATYTFWRYGKSYKIGHAAFYTKDKKFISYIVNVSQFKSPSNAYYVRMSMSTAYFTDGNPIVCKGTDYTGDTTYQNEYKTVVNHYVTREEIAKVNIPDMVESDTLSILTINASNSKKNNLIGFEANFLTMGSVRIAHGTSYDANRSASIVVDATNIYLYDKSTNLRATYPHGLTMDKFITVSIVVGQMRTAKIILTTANGRFIQDSVFWGGCREDVTAQAISGTFTNARLTWYVPDYNHDLWAFGDSYFDFWVADVIQNLGYHNFMSDGFGGRRSTSAFISLKLALAKAMPKKILWCLGMNDPDTEGAINAEWKTTLDNLINLCDEKGIELILCTIPNTPVTVHKYKNAYVKSSGKRYVDVCHAVGADVSPEWYDGMRTNTETDKIHPTQPLGTRTIADYMLENVPELAN